MAATEPEQLPRDAATRDALDRVLVAQLVVAWAGEGGESPRMGWWSSDLLSPDAGEDLFARLLPSTWGWALLRALREVARRHELATIERFHDPDRVITIFHQGFSVDERLDERLDELERSGARRGDALPELERVVNDGWSRERFEAWLRAFGRGPREHVAALAGRHLRGLAPAWPDFEARVRALVAGLEPLADRYPLPHFVLEGERS
jgi:hypothetical protein